jgi:hypothetical protein
MAKLRPVWYLLCVLCAHSVVANAAVPTQFIAKMFTEALGRAPDPQSWINAIDYFQTNGCSQASLQGWGSSTIFASQEFAGLQYDDAATTLVLYRAILNREPDTTGFQTWYSALQQGQSLASVVAALFGTAEFAQLIPLICDGGSYSFETQGSYPAIQIPTSQSGGYGDLTEAGLQNLLNSSGSGSTVYLQQESVVYLTVPLVIPSGVTLSTYGSPGPNRHAVMARLVRDAPFANAMVQINIDSHDSSGALTNVWVDGQRTQASAFVTNATNIEIFGGTAATVDSNFISNTLGWSSLHSFGTLNDQPCSSNTITNNVITVYPSLHTDSEWADGISIGCENSVVENNQVIDATDAGIVVYTAYPATQKSVVTGNTVVSAGNSAYAGLGFDDLQSSGPPDYTGSAINDNTLFSGPNTHFVMGLTVGTRAWYPQGPLGYGAEATGNTTAGIQTLFGEGISVSGITSVTVTGNDFNIALIPQAWTACPIGQVVASVSAGFASGTIQPYSDIEVSGCISDYSPVATPVAVADPPSAAGTGSGTTSSASSASGSASSTAGGASDPPAASSTAASDPPATNTTGASDPPAHGGGGGFGWLELAVLAAMAALRAVARAARASSER